MVKAILSAEAALNEDLVDRQLEDMDFGYFELLLVTFSWFKLRRVEVGSRVGSKVFSSY